MIALLGSLLGFLTSIVPDLFKIQKENADRVQELAILKLQMEAQAQGHTERLEEINASADISEMQEIYKTYNSGIHWVDALNATVRPILTYAFFILYATTKIALFYSAMTLPWATPAQAIVGLWTEEDIGIFSGIVSFYFGTRAMQKLRDK